MQIIYDLYENDIRYDDIDEKIEEKVYEYLNENKKSYDIISENYDTNIQNIFSDRCQNVIKALEFPKNESCLEVIGKFGNLTSCLSKIFKNLTVIETIKNRAEINYRRNEKRDNITIICTSNIFSIKYQRKYDVIVLNGVLENINAIFNDFSKSRFELSKIILERYKKILNPGGKIIVLTNNKLGIKYFAGAKDSEKQISYGNILDTDYKYNKYFSKNELNSIFDSLFKDYKYYYPLPDYTNTSVIYSDMYLPINDFSKIGYNIYYNKFDTIIFNEIQAIKNISKSGYFDLFANSFIVELGENISNFKFTSFNNFRKEDFKLITKIYDKRVEKIGNVSHIKNIERNIDLINYLKIKTLDSYNDDIIISKFTTESTFDKILYNMLLSRNKNEFMINVNKWYSFIKDKFLIKEKYDFEDSIFNKYDLKIHENVNIEELTYLEHGFIDFVFDNIFVINNEFYVYDQEWYEKNVPAEFILYRAISGFYFKNKYAQNILPKEEVYSFFGIQEYITLFEELEKVWQNKIVDKNILAYFESTYSATTTLESLKESLKDINYLKGIINKQTQYINELEEMCNKKNRWKI